MMAPPRSLDDCRCPVCLEIFMEPVTLPCTHTFCKECFLQTVEKAALSCPLCRRRVSVWARLHSRNNSLVNQTLWTQIQNLYPLQCEGRRRGQEVPEEIPGCFPTVSEPGALRQEYEEQISRLTEEQRLLQEEQSRQSEELIRKLLEEEEQQLQEETRRSNDDEKLARLLSSQLNSSVSQVNAPPAKRKKDEQVCLGQMDRFLFPRPKVNLPHQSSMDNKENILLWEKELKPRGDGSPPFALHPASSSASPALHPASSSASPALHPASSSASPALHPASSSASPALHPASSSAPSEEQLFSTSLRTQVTPEKETVCPNRRSEEEEEEEEEEQMATKRVCGSSSRLLQEASDLEAELLSRLQQEEDDRRLALLLQKELDQEERQRATDRRKGSSDAYLLRHDGRRKEEHRGTPRRPCRRREHTSTSCSTPSSSTSSSSRGSKQQTLTDMFSSLNN